jgi:hypothetical protein
MPISSASEMTPASSIQLASESCVCAARSTRMRRPGWSTAASTMASSDSTLSM